MTTSAQSESGYFTKIIELDGEEVSDSSFSLDPGRHSVRVVGKCAPRDKGVAMGAALFSPAVALGASIAAAVDAEKSAKFSGRMKACFIARPGRTYEVRTYAEGGVWKVEVVDQTTTYDVKSPCKSPKTPELRLTGGPQRSPHPFDE